MRNATSSLALLLLIGCGTSLPATSTLPVAFSVQTEFEDHDQDGNAMLDRQEFAGASELIAAALDANGDATLDPSELHDGLFRSFDVNASGHIDRGELARGAMRWWPADVELQYERWNTNPDGGLDEEELTAVLDRMRVVRRWDRDHDGLVSQPEVSRALFATWDTDGDEKIDALEWRWN